MTLFDEEEMFTIFNGRKRAGQKSTTIQPRTWNYSERYGSFDGGMRKPTRQEALDRLPSIPKPVRGLRPKPKNPWLLPLYALDLAEILIYIDPLDRIEG
ncbi:MAG: hypothetical protein NWE77_09140 [Candidatus Bathyarchaeota archaeon]|nr:hypothetical protein [Candidatus Bathyarchaeota archaeon]